MQDLLRLFSLTRPHRWRLALATALVLVSTALNLVVPSQISLLLNTVFTDADGAILNQIALVIGVILVTRLFISVAANYILEWVSERIVSDLRRQLFDHLIRLDLNFYVHTRLGEITSRMTNDVAMVQNAVTSTITNLIDRIILSVGALSIMLFLNWRLTIAVFVTAPLLVVLTRLFGRQVARLTREAQDHLAAANSVMEESMGAIRVVKTFVRERFAMGRFGESIETQFQSVQKRAQLSAFYGPLIGGSFMGGLVLVIWFGGQEVLAGRLTAASLFEFLLYATLIANAMGMFVAAYSTLKRAVGASERIFELLDTQPQIQSPPNAKRLTPIRGSVAFDHVHFAYGTDTPVLADLSFEIQPGELIALVGVSGVGKSTLLDLIPRFYDVTAGKVLVDGVDVRELNLDDLRGGIASVPQETVLFADTVRSNIQFGRLEATEAEVMAAAQAANAHEFIMALPLGYDTLVGERGVRLSGGQRQRIAIARALLKEPAILLLDEATSSLDSESERAVQAALDGLLAARGRTTLVIAHRLSTIRNADRIFVLAPTNGTGWLVESGSHNDLLLRGGVYHHLYHLQFREDVTENGTQDAGRRTNHTERDVLATEQATSPL
jgi:subfamily B ATP-binding cassette protein MsbA